MKKRLFLFGFCMCLMVAHAFAQGRLVTGTVVDEHHDPLPGVTVHIKGTSTGTHTGSDGTYSIRAESGQTLVFSFVGRASLERTVGTADVINVTLKPSSEELEKLVVVGYGTQRKADLTGAVATVDVAKTLGTRPIPDLARGLKGAVPGLTITTQSGQIGTEPHISLRGAYGSLNSGGAKPLILVDGVEVQDLEMINPDDIKSISVLKDAASTSIYGARAAWGVVLITTKTGQRETPARVTYTDNFASSVPISTPQIASGPAGAEMALAALRRKTPTAKNYGILGAYYDDESIQKMKDWEQQYGGKDLGPEMVEGRDFEIRGGHLYFYRPWDVSDLYLRPAPQQKHSLAVSGGSKSTNYYVGLGYLGEGGVLKVNPDRFNRYNVTTSVNTTVNKWLDLRSKMMLSSTLLTQPYFRLNSLTEEGNTYVSPWYNLYRYPKTYPYGTYQGHPFRNLITEIAQAPMNPTKSNLSRIQLGGTITVIPGLTVDADYTYASTNTHIKQVGGPVSGINQWVNKLDFDENFQNAKQDKVMYKSNWNQINTGKLYATLQKHVGDHSFKVIAGGDIEYFEATEQGSTRYGLLDPSLGELSLATGDQYAFGGHSHWSTLGFFGRVNYAYKDKYLLELNGRFDGSSRFPQHQHWGFFPSASAGYILTKEPFMAFTQPVLSFFKIRASYGAVGNQDVGTYRFLSLMTPGNSGWWVNGSDMLTVGTPGALSPSLTWETVSTLDFGVDARLLHDALGVTFDWYNRTTSHMITSGITLPSTFGTSAPVRNYGALQTKGFELALTWNKTFSNGLSVNAMASLSNAVSRLTKFANSVDNINGYYQGKVLGEIWGYQTDRFFTENDFTKDADGNLTPKSGIPDQDDLKGNVSWFHYGPGDIKYKDLNGDGKVSYGANTVQDHGDLRVIGNSTPHYLYGLRLGANFKGFDLSAFVQGVGERQDWPSGPLFIPGYQYNEAWYANQEDYWTPQNPDAFYPRPTNNSANNNNLDFRVQTKYLLNMAYTRLKDLTIGYTIPEKYTSKVFIHKARVYVSGENLLTLDHLTIPIDPEVDYTDTQKDERSFGKVYPYRKTYSFGVQVTF